MWIIVAALLMGIIAGAVRLLPDTRTPLPARLMTATLLLMLGALGAQIGSNGELMANLASLGWRAAVISAMSTAGSVVALYLVVKHFRLAAAKGGDT